MMNPSQDSRMDEEYDKKFKEMQKYVPFLEELIGRSNHKPSQESQMTKLKNLYATLTNNTRRLKMDTLLRCEEVLKKLWVKCEKGTSMSSLGGRKGKKNPTRTIDITSPDREKHHKIAETAVIPPVVTIEEAEGESSVHRSTDDSPQSPDDNDVVFIPEDPKNQNDDCIEVLETERNDSRHYNSMQNECWEIPRAEPEMVSDNEVWEVEEPEEEEQSLIQDRIQAPRKPESMENNWTPSMIKEYHQEASHGSEVVVAAKAVADKLSMKRSEERTSHSTATVYVPALEGSRRVKTFVQQKLDCRLSKFDNKSADPQILDPKPSESVAPRVPRSDLSPLADSPSSPTPSTTQPLSFLDERRVPNSQPQLSLLDKFLARPPLSDSDVKQLLNEASGPEGEKLEKAINDVNENMKKLGNDAENKESRRDPRSKDDKHLRKSLFHSSFDWKTSTNSDKSKSLTADNALAGEKSKEKSSTFHTDENNSNILIINTTPSSPLDSSTERGNFFPKEPRVPLHPPSSNDFYQARGSSSANATMNPPSNFGPMLPSLMNMPKPHDYVSPPIAPSSSKNYGVDPNQPLTPNAYCGTMGNAMMPDYRNSFRNFNAASTSVAPMANPYQMTSPNMMQDWNRPPIPAQRPGLLPLDSRPMNDHNRMGNHYNNPINMVPQNMPPAQNFPQYYQQPEAQHRPTWDGNSGNSGDGFGCRPQGNYIRPTTSWGNSRGGYENRDSRFVRDNRNDNRDPRDPRSFSDRDPRNLSDRDPRLRSNRPPSPVNRFQRPQKDPIPAKPMAKVGSHSTSSTSKDSPKSDEARKDGSFRDKSKGKKSMDFKSKRPASTIFNKKEKPKQKPKDMQSPLESLYGVVDTKTGPGYGIQKFKIPKIKRSEPPQASSPSPPVIEESNLDSFDQQSEGRIESSEINKVEQPAKNETSGLKLEDIDEIIEARVKQMFEEEKKKKMKKVVQESSGSSSSNEDESEDSTVEKKKKKKKRKVKRRIIDSDSSGGETSLADRLGEIEPSSKMSDEDKESGKKSKVKKAAKKKEKPKEPEKKKKATETDETSAAESEEISKKTALDSEITAESKKVESEDDEKAKKDVEADAKVAKPKKQRRSSLDKLHDDIRESIALKDVLTATGQRTCRLPKDGQSINYAMESEIGSAVPEDEAKTKKKPRKSRSKQVQPKESAASSKDSSKEREPPKPAMKEPRVLLEKTDLSAKLVELPQFDSSSEDESLGIDTDGLVATVDISLNHSSPKSCDTKQDASSGEESDASTVSSGRKKKSSREESLERSTPTLKQGKKRRKNNWQQGILAKKRKPKKKAGKSSSVKNSKAMMPALEIPETSSAENKEEEPKSLEVDVESKSNPSSGFKIKLNELVEYIWSMGQTFKCLYCSFNGKNIVHHYVVLHPTKEVLISRLSVEGARNAIREAKAVDFQEQLEPGAISKFSCRFCKYATSCGVPALAVESFFEHCTTHTGEYRYRCTECHYRAASESTVRTHFYKSCKKVDRAKKAVGDCMKKIQMPSEGLVFGYICSRCNYVQLEKENVEEHMRVWHQNKKRAEVVKINMSLTLKTDVIVKPDPDAETTSQESESVFLKPEIKKEEPEDPLSGVDYEFPDELMDVLPDESFKHEVLGSPEKPAKKSPKKPRTPTKKAEEDDKSKKNLSAFVCPPGLEQREEEIQLERKKKMQEVADSMGIKAGNEDAKKRLSIIDKLKDRMETSDVDSENQSELAKEMEFAEAKSPSPVEVSVPEIKTEKVEEQESKESDDDRDRDPLKFNYESDSDTDREDSSTDVNSLLKETSNINSLTGGSVMTTIQRLAEKLRKPTENVLPESLVEVKQEKVSLEDEVSRNLSSDDEKTTLGKKIKMEKPDEDAGNVNILCDEKLPSDSEKTPPAEELKKPFITVRRLSDLVQPEITQEPESDAVASAADSLAEPGFIKISNVVSLAPNSGNDSVTNEIRKSIESPNSSKRMSLLKNNSVILQKMPQGYTISPQKSSKEPVKLIPKKLIPLTALNSHNIQQSAVTYHLDPTNMKLTVTNSSPSNQTILKSPIITSPQSIRNPQILTSQSVLNPAIVASNQNMRPGIVTSIGSLRGAAPISANLPTLRTKNAVLLKPTASVTPAVPSYKVVQFVVDRVNAPKSKIQLSLWNFKSNEAYAAMLNPEKLLHLYKCMGHDCSFTTNATDQAKAHCVMHEKEKKTYHYCPYCVVPFSNAGQLLKHYDEKHYFCNFQCCYCFYRAVCKIYVEVHQSLVHPELDKRVLERKVTEMLVVPDPKFNRRNQVPPYMCKKDCSKFFFVPEAFEAHLKMKHKDMQVYGCHLCSTMFLSTGDLIGHYKSHDICKYQCLHCIFGAATLSEIHVHLSTKHYYQLPIVLERTLPPKPSKLKSALDQLLTRNLGDQTSEMTLNAQGFSDFDNVAKKLQFSLKSSNGSDEFQNVLYINPHDSTTKVPDPIGLKRMLPDSQTKERKRMRKEALSGVKNEDSDKVTNLIPENQQCSSGIDVCKTSAKSLDADDDSDIEILEDNVPSSKPEKLSEPTESAEIKAKEEPNCDESSMLLDDASDSMKMPGKQFLTLEDIKDTGVTGADLYICPYESCGSSQEEVTLLKTHIKECIHGGERNSMVCAHCKKVFQKMGFFVEHLKLHGLKRFGCVMCGERFSTQYQVMIHMKGKHKVTCKMVPADPKNPSPDNLFIAHPVSFCLDKTKSRKRSYAKQLEVAKVENIEKLSFGSGEIDLLPMQAIYSREVHCAVCSYTTKVRMNIIRHLQLHAKDKTVPETGPVNPVPCLDKKEKMFDKMVNLASSSHQSGRMGMYQKEAASVDDTNLPKFVPENKRYVCGVAECSYLSVDEAMLRCHLKALHSDEPYFLCPHCPQQTGQDTQNITIDKMGVHLKMHDTRLYKCSHCNYHHCHRHVVERHLTDKHPEKKQFIKVVRELDTLVENEKPAAQEDLDDEQPDPDGNHWRCNSCDFKCVYKSDMATHVLNAHEEKCQFKCNQCTFKTPGKITLDQHFSSKHALDVHASYTMVYQKIKGVRKLEVEGVHHEPFDTTPLWRRDMPRIRHIRGILLEDEDGESSEKVQKVEGETPKIPKYKRQSYLDECQLLRDKIANLSSEEVQSETKESANADRGIFGPYGEPSGVLYTCTLCMSPAIFKTKYKHDMRDHLYRELRYTRWDCKYCEYLAVNRNTLLKHYIKNHPEKEADCTPMAPNQEVEVWVSMLLLRQSEIMKKMAQEKPIEPENVYTFVDNEKVEYAPETKVRRNVQKESKPAKPQKEGVISCKHCKKKFKAWRGFKRHVRLSHLQCYRYLCSYCNRSSRAEALLQQHIRSKHPGYPEKVIINSKPIPEYTNEFWTREYGFVPAKQEKEEEKVALVPAVSQGPEGTRFSCSYCNYKAINLAGLKSHVRTHERILKCAYCTYTTPYQSELTSHSDVNHPHVPVKFQARKISPPKTSEEETEVEVVTINDYEDEIEEEEEEEEMDDSIVADPLEQQPVYCCNHCAFCSISIEAIRTHWIEEHKSASLKFGCHKLKEDSAKIVFKCCYCNVTSSVMNLVIHITQHHGNVPVNFMQLNEIEMQESWFCLWCDEICDSRVKAKHHHKMFHSHLNAKYKKLPMKIYKCPECEYNSGNLAALRKHVSGHIKLFKCKYCSETFKKSQDSKKHNSEIHPGLEPKLESILNFESSVNQLMIRAVKDVVGESLTLKTGNSGTARKSTSKQSLLLSPPRPRAVARKSTTPKKRLVLGYSFYRKPKEPVDLGTFTSQITVGGRQMTVNCLTLASIMDINPKVILKDIRQ